MAPMLGQMRRKDGIEKESRLFPLPGLPNGSDPASPGATSSGRRDFLLALAQLGALRLNAKRCIISVVHRDMAYILAEATRTLSLMDDATSEQPGDVRIFATSCVPKVTSFCPFVVDHKGPGILMIPDMTKDHRFWEHPLVTGEQHARCYAAAPLKSSRGVNIGAVAIIDDEIRSGLNEHQQNVLIHIAELVMDHLEVRREAEEKNKLHRMSQGLNTFVQGKGRLAFNEALADTPSSPLENGNGAAVAANGGTTAAFTEGTAPSVARPPLESHHSTDESFASHEQSDYQGKRGEAPRASHESMLSQTLSRAASLLSDSLNLQGTGGTVFLGVVQGSAEGRATSDCVDQEGPDRHNSISRLADEDVYSVGVSDQAKVTPAEVLAECVDPADGIDSATFRPMCQEALRRMVKRYPTGKLWVFDEDASLVSSEDERIARDSEGPGLRPSQSSSSRRKQEAEASVLQRSFPGARYIICTPLWDATELRHSSVCFSFTTSPLQCFGPQAEFMFLSVFSNSITAEISRLVMLDADRKKLDFLGSISHELRSPLHGILASAEFLAETKVDVSQAQLVHNIEMCGRSLLQEIQSILEFSRINSSEATRRRSHRSIVRGAFQSRKEKFSAALPGGLSAIGNTNVAAVTEEVIESVFVARRHTNAGATDVLDVSAEGQENDGTSSSHDPAAPNEGSGIEVILDFDQDLKGITHPRALQRVIVNLFTNAMKYTQAGLIHVKVRRVEAGRQENGEKRREMIAMTIRDTGKGISPAFLKNQVFTPFAQEDSLTPGTGLGLSIVRSILTALDGTISIHSKVHEGTEVRVSLPILPSTKAGTAPSSTVNSAAVGSAATISSNISSSAISGSGSTISHDNASESLAALRLLTPGRKVALCGFESASADSKHLGLLREILEAYVTKWYGLQCTSGLDESDPPHLAIVHEKGQKAFFEESPRGMSIPVIILCKIDQQEVPRNVLPHQVYRLFRPFGPYRLAKVIASCFDKLTPQPPDAAEAVPEVGRDIVSPGRIRGPLLCGKSLELPVLAHSGSENAHMAVSPATERQAKENRGFPFPMLEPEGTSKAPEKQGAVKRPSLSDLKREVMSDSVVETMKPTSLHDRMIATSKHGVLATATPADHLQPRPTDTAPVPTKRQPTVLLVEDNKINLMLLRTFMKKRRYRNVDQAENGQLAVNAAQSRDYDIIFMDLSMPIMGGFQATREIRATEQRRRRQYRRQSALTQKDQAAPDEAKAAEVDDTDSSGAGAGTARPAPPALIIALTGLASSQDQREAIASGCDLFMTKPTSFKEVGQLLDNWEANGERTNFQSSIPRLESDTDTAA